MFPKQHNTNQSCRILVSHPCLSRSRAFSMFRNFCCIVFVEHFVETTDDNVGLPKFWSSILSEESATESCPVRSRFSHQQTHHNPCIRQP